MEEQERIFNKKLEQSYAEAEETIKDVDKLERLLQILERKLKVVPVAGTALAYIPIFASIVRMYIKKEYTEIPVASLAAIVATIIYLVNPVDIIPDFIPGLGYIDDAIVVTGALALVKTDLDDYLRWRKENGMEVTDIPNYEDVAGDAKGATDLVKAFFAGKKAGKN